MKFCSFYSGDDIHVGIYTETGIADLTLSGIPGDMNAIIANADAYLPEINALITRGGVHDCTAPIKFADVTNPGKIACVGLNYKSHAEETGGKAPEHPVIFSKFSDCLCAGGENVFLPRHLRCFDYEAELVIVIGRHAWCVEPENALSYVFGYTCGNDLSARDCQFVSNQWLIGKSLPGFAPAGPTIVTRDSFDPSAANAVQCRVNGVLVQDGSTDDMIFSCAEIISYCSHYFALEPGDLIFTGTPAGVILGKAKGTRVWLKPGDELEVTIAGIGTLKNKLV